ncbi:hypothetical protein VNO80_05584 [Phaseolus coccineus]|uniref:Uncharacterized protein n=1 Tax=Phaseolus coccineus TaxID=3886 RepID=A0AAN9RI72_PHACN
MWITWLIQVQIHHVYLSCLYVKYYSSLFGLISSKLLLEIYKNNNYCSNKLKKIGALFLAFAEVLALLWFVLIALSLLRFSLL